MYPLSNAQKNVFSMGHKSVHEHGGNKHFLLIYTFICEVRANMLSYLSSKLTYWAQSASLASELTVPCWHEMHLFAQSQQKTQELLKSQVNTQTNSQWYKLALVFWVFPFTSSMTYASQSSWSENVEYYFRVGKFLSTQNLLQITKRCESFFVWIWGFFCHYAMPNQVLHSISLGF